MKALIVRLTILCAVACFALSVHAQTSVSGGGGGSVTVQVPGTVVSKSQTTAVASDFGTLTLAGSTDIAWGYVDVTISSNDAGGHTWAYAVRVPYDIVKNAGGDFAAVMTSSASTRQNVYSAAGSFSPTAALSIAFTGDVATFTVTTTNGTGTQAAASVTVVIVDSMAHAITAL